PRVPGVVPERPGGGAEQLPARAAAVRGQPLCRGERRVREGRVRLSEAREERRRGLRRVARLRGGAQDGGGRRAAGAAARDRRERTALRADLPRRLAQRLG